MSADQLGFPFLPKLRAGAKLTETAFELPEKLTFEEWQEIGQGLSRIEQATQWWFGDWWRRGEAYGDRVSIVNSEEWSGPAHQTCRGAAVVCGVFEVFRRRNTLSFSFHQEVAALPIEEADQLLDWCEEPLKNGEKRPRTRAELREQVKKVKAYLAQGWNSSQLERKSALERGETVLANMSNDEKGVPVDNALITWADSEGKAVRIDRMTEWGNVYEVDVDGTREEVIKWYKEYFSHKRALQARIPTLKGKLIICWCHPCACHGDYLASLANKWEGA